MKNKASRQLNTFVILGVLVAVSAFLWATDIRASDRPEVDYTSIIIPAVSLSEVQYSDFTFTTIGAKWDNSLPLDAVLSIRVLSNNEWSGWYEMERLLDAPDGWQKNGKEYSQPIFVNEGTAWQYSVQTSEQAALHQEITFHYFNLESSEDAPVGFFEWLRSLVQGASADELLNADIISRAGWEADETWRETDNGSTLWDPEYAMPEKIIIHHTAGSDGGNDPASIVRAIYYWHAVVLEWGDIGYNYLIDSEGNIYEGRAGGDGVIGGHAYNEKLEIGYNRGTIGIALLGNYESKIPTDAAITALTKLVAVLGARFNIEPEGESYFINGVIPNVVGHKDVDNTLCPGVNLYDDLDTIRLDAQAIFDTAGGQATNQGTFKAAYVSQSDQIIEVPTGGSRQVWVEFRNVGTATWRNYETPALAVFPTETSSRLAIADGDAPSDVSESTAVLTTPNVEPDEVGRFVFTIQAPEDELEVTEIFVVQLGDQTIAHTAFTITARVTGFTYAAALEEVDILPATFTSAKHGVTVQFVNRGQTTWQRGDIKLAIYDLGNSVSRYYDPSWPDESGLFDFTEETVEPNKLATFNVLFKSPYEPGLYLNVYKAVGPDDLIQKEDRSVTRVDSKYKAELLDTTVPPALLSAWRPEVTLRFKNTGLVPWDRTIGLQVADFGGAISTFVDSSWDDIRIATHLNEVKVEPGEIGTFTLRLHPPQIVGLYLNTFRVFKDGRPVPGGSFNLITRVD
ncbi:N-acetylmuramoyl-L-alanine amidase [Patescibacteria group bacterium]